MVWYSAIPLGNWRKPINLNLHGTLHGELRVPFAQHVSLSDAPSSNASFPQFTLLPLELQLRVIYCCDQSTLFQLMHTSSFMRAEARKLFFSDPEAFYSIDAEWLLEGAYPGYTVHDLNFMMCVEHLVIEFAWMKEDTWMDLAEQRSWNYVDKVLTTGMLGNIRKFWSMVQLRFPRLKRVMISDDYDRSGLYWKVGEMGPTDIKVFVALRQGGDEYPCGRSERRLWQRIVTSQADTHTDTKLQWEKRLPWCEPLIIMPYRGLHGLVGKFQDFYIRQEHWHRQGRAIRIFEIAAVEKYHFDGHHCSFRCSVQDCNTVFQQPEEYTTHAIDTGHDKMHPLPESFKNLFAKNDKQRELLKEDLSKRRKHILEQCGSEGSSQRQAAMKEIMHQLENNALLSAQGKPASEHKWWDIIDGFLYPRDG